MTAWIPNEADCGGEIKYRPVEPRRRLGANEFPSKFLEKGIVPYVGQLSWTEDPLQDSGHVDIKQGLCGAVAE